MDAALAADVSALTNLAAADAFDKGFNREVETVGFIRASTRKEKRHFFLFAFIFFFLFFHSFFFYIGLRQF